MNFKKKFEMYQKKQQNTLFYRDLASNQSFFNKKQVTIKGLFHLKIKPNFLSQSLFLTSTRSNLKVSCLNNEFSWSSNLITPFLLPKKLKNIKFESGTKLSSSWCVNSSLYSTNQNVNSIDTQTIDIGLKEQKIIKYSLDSYNRSNQDTCLLHRPAVFEGQWVQSGDLLADCASSVGGELALGQNLLIAYMPWEGYNYEDAILISERLVYDDLYTSVHIEKYELETRERKLGKEEITREIPDILESDIDHLDQNGIVKVGSWVEEGDILVGKTTPINKKSQSPYQKLLSTILEKDLLTVRDSSLRAPKGIRAKIVKVQLFQKKKANSSKFKSFESLNEKPKGLTVNNGRSKKKLNFNTKGLNLGLSIKKQHKREEYQKNSNVKFSKSSVFSLFFLNDLNNKLTKKKTRTNQMTRSVTQRAALRDLRLDHNKLRTIWKGKQNFKKSPLTAKENNSLKRGKQYSLENSSIIHKKKKVNKNDNSRIWISKDKKRKKQQHSKPFFSSGLQIHLYLAEKRKVQVGDKLAGRHGNKGIISQILPREDMPYLPDGTPIDMVLNPLGVPSRMNVGQIYECLLGLAGKFLGENYKVFPFDEIYGPEASRSFVFSKLNEARKKTGLNWIFDSNTPGKIRLYDGRTGDCFDQAITVGQAYILRLVHMVDDKIHCLTPEHEVLTTEGWVSIGKINRFHNIATLQKNGDLQYQNPIKIFNYSNFKGTLYHIKNANLDLKVTLNHRMYVKSAQFDYDNLTSIWHSNKSLVLENFEGYKLIEAQTIIGKYQCYLKNANWVKPHYQFSLPSTINNSIQFQSNSLDMNSWLVFFGICVAKGYYLELPSRVQRFSVLEKNKMHDVENTRTEIQKKNKRTSYSVEISLNSVELNFPSFVKPNLISSVVLTREKNNNKGEMEAKKRNSNVLFSTKVKKEAKMLKTENIRIVLLKALDKLGFNYFYEPFSNKVIINNKQLWNYLKTLSSNPSNQVLPPWVWDLSKEQARLLLETMLLVKGIKRKNSGLKPQTLKKNDHDYYTLSNQLADDLMRLALHAGWSGNKLLLSKAKGFNTQVGTVLNSIDSGLYPQKEKVYTNNQIWRVSIIQTNQNPSVNNSKAIDQNVQTEELLTYQGSVYCLSVPNEVFYVRRNGLPVWTGNSRSIGPYSLVTQQPLRGRSKQGGQRLGEMEVWALEGYGAAFTLLEMLTLKSDDMTGRMTLWSNLILNGEISIGTPESFKVLICELQALCLDIGLYRVNQTDLRSSSNTSNGSSLVAVENLLNFK